MFKVVCGEPVPKTVFYAVEPFLKTIVWIACNPYVLKVNKGLENDVLWLSTWQFYNCPLKETLDNGKYLPVSWNIFKSVASLFVFRFCSFCFHLRSLCSNSKVCSQCLPFVDHMREISCHRSILDMVNLFLKGFTPAGPCNSLKTCVC